MAQTTKSLREQVIRQVKENGGFTVFYATARLDRARVIDQLQKEGTIKRKTGKAFGQFSWCGYEVKTL
jgi:hypothetical protein